MQLEAAEANGCCCSSSTWHGCTLHTSSTDALLSASPSAAINLMRKQLPAVFYLLVEFLAVSPEPNIAPEHKEMQVMLINAFFTWQSSSGITEHQEQPAIKECITRMGTAPKAKGQATEWPALHSNWPQNAAWPNGLQCSSSPGVAAPRAPQQQQAQPSSAPTRTVGAGAQLGHLAQIQAAHMHTPAKKGSSAQPQTALLYFHNCLFLCRAGTYTQP